MRKNLPKRKVVVKVNLAKTESRRYHMLMLLTGPDITAIRNALGMNLKEFGKYLGVAEPTVCRWEAGQRHPKWKMMETLNELAEQVQSRNGHSRNGRRKAAAGA